MTKDTYYAGMYWGNRTESVEECARRTHLMLQGLSHRDVSLGNWYARGRSHKDALARPLDVSEESLRALVRRGRNRRDMDGTVIEDLGFSLGAWNGGSGGGDCGFHLSCGGYASTSAVWIPNSCVLDLPDEGAAFDRVVIASTVLKIVETMATALEPHWGVVTSRAYRDMAPEGEPGTPLVGWLTYLKVPERQLPPLPADVRVVPLPDRGSIIVITDERFTAEEPRHVAAAEAVRRVLSEAGLLRRPA